MIIMDCACKGQGGIWLLHYGPRRFVDRFSRYRFRSDKRDYYYFYYCQDKVEKLVLVITCDFIADYHESFLDINAEFS